MNYPIVEVIWVDAVASGLDEWVDISDVKTDVHEVVSVGYLLDDEYNVTLAQNYDMNGEKVCNVITIPWECVVDMYELDCGFWDFENDQGVYIGEEAGEKEKPEE